MENLVPVVIAVISSGSLTAIITNAINKRKLDCVKQTSLVTAVRLLLQDKIEHLGFIAVSENRIAYTKLKFLNAAFACFKALGGDGDLDQLMADVREVDVIYTTPPYAPPK